MDQRIHAAEDTVQLSSIVERVEWQPGAASIHVRSTLDGSRHELRSRRVIVTIPLVVLQARPDSEGAIQFVPEPREALEAARSLAFGNVFRVTLRFHRAFWESNREALRNRLPVFAEPVLSHLVDSQSGLGARAHRLERGTAADPLIGMSRSEIVASALSSLQQILGMPALEPRAAYFHDWQADPFTRGAYSYVPAGALAARRILAQPISDTLCFAGEATDLTGHSATAHGAIASGRRVAGQIVAFAADSKQGHLL